MENFPDQPTDMGKTRLKAMLIKVLVLIVAILGVSTLTLAQDKKPNIVVIWGDDIGVHNINAYNHGIMSSQQAE